MVLGVAESCVLVLFSQRSPTSTFTSLRLLLGSFVQLYKLHKDVSTAASKKRTPTSSTTSTASETLRFSYLPVSLPALRGGSGRDAEKGEVDWGVIQDLKDESNEQSNVFSKIASFF